MSNFSKHISTLLYNHDCVIIPQFGGFVANPHPAKINKLKSQIEAPYKEIGFNPRLTKNDGLLANHIRNEENITYESALKHIAEQVDNIWNTVKSGRTFSLEEIGSFYLDSNKSLRFSAAKSANFDLDFFGLDAVPALRQEVEKLAAETTIETPVVELEEKVETPVVPLFDHEQGISASTNWKNIAVAVACVPFLLYLLWVPTRIDGDSQQDFQMSDLNPYVEQPCASYEARTSFPSPLNIDKEVNSNVFKDLANSNENYVQTSFFAKGNPHFDEGELVTIELRNFPAEAVTTAVAHAYQPKNKLQNYYVIGGCFREYNNANKFIGKLRKQGFDAVLIDKKGSLYRVGVEGASTIDAIVVQLDRVRAAGYSDAWVLKK